MSSYARKRVSRSWKLFLALLIGVTLATTFFVSVNIAADITARDALERSLEDTEVDATINIRNSLLTETNLSALDTGIADVDFVIGTEFISYHRFKLTGFNENFTWIGLQDNSRILEDFTIVEGNSTLGENETWVDVNSENIDQLNIGDEIPVAITVYRDFPNLPITIDINLTIAGIIRLSDTARSLATPRQTISFFGFAFESDANLENNLILSDWNTTVTPIIDEISQVPDAVLSDMHNYYFIDLDKDSLISPYDIENSLARIDQVLNQIRNIAQPFGVEATNVNNRLAGPLNGFQITSQFLTFGFILNAVPVFFMAIYTGTMVSDVTFNLRRREIGLLITRGMTQKSIRNIFLTEAAFIGVFAGIVGNLLGVAITPIMLGTWDFSNAFASVLLDPTTNIIAVVFGVILSLFAVYRPARRASNLEALDALREYVYVEEKSPYKKILPYTAFILGSYKIIAWIVGLNIQDILTSTGLSNILTFIFLAIWSVIDQALNFIGPLLFLYGATRILLRGSFKFQRFIVRTGRRILGEFGNLATRNVQRNPTRNASLVFIVALIVSFGFSTIGTLASTLDLEVRTFSTDVGADANAFLRYPSNISTILPLIEEIEGVEQATPELRFGVTSSIGSLAIRAVNPDEFLAIGYYEKEWFSGGDTTELFGKLDNSSIILSQEAADSLDLELNDSIAITVDETGNDYSLQIVGIFGPKGLEIEIFGFAFTFFTGQYWSYVSTEFYNLTGISQTVDTKILVDTVDFTNGTAIAEEISSLSDDVISTNSITQEEISFFENPTRSGLVKVQSVGVIFAGLLTVVGTGLVITMTLQEKRVELALMNVRGLQRRQLEKTLFAELIVLIFFSILLGAVTGIIQIIGNVLSAAESSGALLSQQLVITPLIIFEMIAIIITVLISVTIPVLLAARRANQDIDTLRR